MALTKISRSLLDTGVSDSSDATAITISSSEQVMIGTTDAGYPDYGDSLTLGDVDGGGGNSGMTIRSGTSSYGTFYFSDATGTAAGTYAGKMQYNHSTNSMVFGTNSSDRLTIDSSGNVGIGTTSPPHKFSVFGTGFGNATIQIEGEGGADPYINFLANNAQHWSLGVDDSDSDKFKIAEHSALGTNDYFVVDTSGNVGIGTTSPSMKVNISHGDQDGLRFNCANTAETFIDFGDTDDNDIGRISYDHADNHMAFRTNNAERMRLNTSGKLLLGSTSDSFDNNSKIVLHPGSDSYIISSGQLLSLNRTGAHGAMIGFYYQGSFVGSISSNANSLPSDKNFKRDISDLDLGLNLITKLKPSQYNYKIDSEDCPKMYGLIAQDLEESLTEVGVEKNSSWLLQHKPNDDEKESQYEVDYLKLTPVLIKAIQELLAKVEELESKINE